MLCENYFYCDISFILLTFGVRPGSTSRTGKLCWCHIDHNFVRFIHPKEMGLSTDFANNNSFKYYYSFQGPLADYAFAAKLELSKLKIFHTKTCIIFRLCRFYQGKSPRMQRHYNIMVVASMLLPCIIIIIMKPANPSDTPDIVRILLHFPWFDNFCWLLCHK